MQTTLSQEARQLPRAEEAERILRSCVHCGFCNATCPTYQLLGDELDGPRGRIYLIKQVLEGNDVTRKTQAHLDRCLSCRNCETTCPSGVDYHNLLDIGRTRRCSGRLASACCARGYAPWCQNRACLKDCWAAVRCFAPCCPRPCKASCHTT